MRFLYLIENPSAYANGFTIRAWHGTSHIFDVFRTSINYGKARGFKPNDLGAWFSESEELANAFASDSAAKTGKEPRIIEVFLRILNPKIYRSYGQFLRDTEARKSASAMRRDLIREGYDGVVIYNSTTDSVSSRTDYVIFYPNQVKSVNSEIPSSQRFNPNSDNINY